MGSPRSMFRWLCLCVVAGTSLTCSADDDSVDKTNLEFRRGQAPSHRHLEQIRPIVSCIEASRQGGWVARFGYENASDGHGTLAIPIGPFNAFQGMPRDRGQPHTFWPGRHDDVVRVIVHRGDFPLVWKLGLHSAGATRESPRCGSSGSGGAGGAATGGTGTGGSGTGGAGIGTGGAVVDGGAVDRDSGLDAVDGADATGGSGGDPCPGGCNDGDPCTLDRCLGPSCGHYPLCGGQGPCRPEICVVSASGAACVIQTTPDGTSCRPDSPTCSENNVCRAGQCVPATPVCGAPPPTTCVGPSACIDGKCRFPNLDGPPRGCRSNTNLCIFGVCPQGTVFDFPFCHAAVETLCFATDRCHVAGVCDPATGLCSSPPAPDGTSCEDGNRCNGAEICQAGVCTGGTPVANGTSCGSNDPCSGVSACQDGACVTSPTLPPGAVCDVK